ncbi:MAG: hypothetical protein EP329_16450 [Deltaproteobacteria bacterium]|nr:MAG: hypothetical protein EP329_16450 [Deltaproteobacteria bacterium]
MKKARGTRSDLVMLLVGQAGMLLAYGLFLAEIALGSGPSAPLPIILLSGLPIAAGIGLNHVSPPGLSRAVIAGWIALLAPLVTVWIYASVRPSFGDATSAATAVDVLLVLNLLAGLLGAWGLARSEERTSMHLAAAGLWALGALLAIVTMLAGHTTLLVIASFAATLLGQGLTVVALRREDGYSLASAALAS